MSCSTPHPQVFLPGINSIQLHDSFVMVPLESISLNYIKLYYLGIFLHLLPPQPPSRNPIIHTLMIKMPKLSQPAMPHHISHTLNVPIDCTIPQWAFYPSLQTSISPSLALYSPNFTNSLSRIQSHMSKHYGHNWLWINSGVMVLER